MKWYYKLLMALVIIAIIFFLGFLVGKKSVRVTRIEDIKYVKGDSVYIKVDSLVPYKVVVPTDTASVIRKCVADGIYTELFPVIHKTDTLYATPYDPNNIITDWGTERSYSKVLLDNDTLGFAKVDAVVQYNRIKSLNAVVTPVVKSTSTTIIKERLFEPFLGLGIGTNSYGVVQAGAYFKGHYGFTYQYQRGFTNNMNIHSIMLNYKF